MILPLIGSRISDYTPFLSAMNSSGILNAEYSILIVLWDYQVGSSKCMDNLAIQFVFWILSLH